MMRKIFMGMLKAVGIVAGLFIFTRIVGLIIPVNTLNYKEVPDGYFEVTGAQVLPDDQNQYVRFVDFMSGEYSISMSGKNKLLSEEYMEILNSGDYVEQMDRFLLMNTGAINQLAQFYEKVYPQLELIVTSGNRGAVDLNEVNVINAQEKYINQGKIQLIRDLNILAGQYCKMNNFDKCFSYQKLALSIGQKEIDARGPLILTLIGLLNTKTTLKNILYLQQKGYDIKVSTGDLSVINRIGYKDLFVGEYITIKNTVECMSDTPNYGCERVGLEAFGRQINIIDMNLFDGYLKDYLYQASTCDTLSCIDNVDNRSVDFANNITSREKIKPMFGMKHMKIFIAKINLIAFLPNTKSAWFTLNEVKDLVILIK